MSNSEVEQIASEIEVYQSAGPAHLSESRVPRFKLEQWAREIRERLVDNPKRLKTGMRDTRWSLRRETIEEAIERAEKENAVLTGSESEQEHSKWWERPKEAVDPEPSTTAAPKEYGLFNVDQVEVRLAQGWRLQGGAVQSKGESWYQAMVR